MRQRQAYEENFYQDAKKISRIEKQTFENWTNSY